MRAFTQRRVVLPWALLAAGVIGTGCAAARHGDDDRSPGRTAAPPSAQPPDGDATDTALLIAAAKRGDAEELRRLLAGGADARPPTREDRVWLMQNAAGNPDALRVLIDAGADVSTVPPRCTGPGDVAIGAAARALEPRSVRMLIDAGVDNRAVLAMVLTTAVGAPRRDREKRSLETDERRAKRLELVRLLLDEGANVLRPEDLSVALYSAASYGHEAETQLLLDRGAVVPHIADNEETRRGWFVFALLGDRDAAQRLARIGVQPDIHAASAFGFPDRVRELLQRDPAAAKGVNPGATPLTFAALGGHLDIVNLLLDAGAEVNPKFEHGGWFGSAPLEAAVARGHVTIAERLIAAGADVNVRDKEGETLLARLLEDTDADGGKVNPAMIDLLRRHGASIERGTPEPADVDDVTPE